MYYLPLHAYHGGSRAEDVSGNKGPYEKWFCESCNIVKGVEGMITNAPSQMIIKIAIVLYYYYYCYLYHSPTALATVNFYTTTTPVDSYTVSGTASHTVQVTA